MEHNFFIRKRNDGRYEGRINVNSKYKSFYGKTEIEVRKKIEEKINSRIYQISNKKSSKKEARVFTPFELNYFLTCIRSHPMGNLFEFQLNTGLRIGEVLGLQWSDINLLENEVSVIQSLGYKKSVSGRFEKVLSTTKNKKHRKVPLNDNARNILMKINNSSTNSSKFVFCNTSGKVPSRRSIELSLKEIFELMVTQISKDQNKDEIYISLKPFTSHTLRHTFTTIAIDNGISIKVLSEWLGHSSIKVTGDCYGHLLDNTVSKSKDILNSIFKWWSK